MNFEFTEEQKLFAEAVRKFAVAELEAILKNSIAEEIFDRRFDERGRQADAAE